MDLSNLFKTKSQIAEEATLNELEALGRFLEDNSNLAKMHGLRTPIRPEEVKAIDETFSKAMKHVDRKIKYLENHPGKEDDQILTDEKLAAIVEQVRKKYTILADPITTALLMEKNFEVFNSKAGRKNLAIDGSVKNQSQLLLELLSKNDGIAFGDFHTKSAMGAFVAKNMAAMKKAGMDTIYIECDAKEFEMLTKKDSIQRLEELVDNSRYEASKAYGVDIKDIDRVDGYVMVYLEAKKHGIRMVNVDSRLVESEYINNLEFSTHTRFSHTNFEWSEAIKRDRKAHPNSGKYVVFGGANHFANLGTDMGQVDDALGIPSLAFTKSPAKDNGFSKGAKQDGIDFWLDAGSHYEPFKEASHKMLMLAKKALETPDVAKEISQLGINPKLLFSEQQPVQGNLKK